MSSVASQNEDTMAQLESPRLSSNINIRSHAPQGSAGSLDGGASLSEGIGQDGHPFNLSHMSSATSSSSTSSTGNVNVSQSRLTNIRQRTQALTSTLGINPTSSTATHTNYNINATTTSLNNYNNSTISRARGPASTDSCQLTLEDLLKAHETTPDLSPLNLFSLCPCCSVMVARHPRQPTSAVQANAYVPVSPRPHGLEDAQGSHSVSSKAGEGFLKLKRDLPIWREGSRKTCVEFLRDITELLAATEFPRNTWYRVLPLVVEEGFNRTWVHNNIVSRESPPASWEDACSLFTSHFECADYLDKVWSKWHSLRFDHGESVQHFADRFMVMLSELELASDDKVVKKHFLKCLPAQIRQRYDEFCLAQEISLDAEEGSRYDPDRVETIIKVCVRIDISIRNRSHGHHTTSSSSSSSSHMHPTRNMTQSSYTSAKKCHIHPTSGHSWADCRQNPSNSHSVSNFKMKQEPSFNKFRVQDTKPTTMSRTPQASTSHQYQQRSVSTSSSSSVLAKNALEGVKCYKCNQNGHYANKCTSTVKSTNSPHLKMLQADHEEELVLASVATDATTVVLPPNSSPSTSISGVDLLGKGRVLVELNGRIYSALPDSGADLSVIDKSLADKLELARVPSKGRLSLAVIDAPVQRKYRTIPLKFQVRLDSDLAEFKQPSKSFEGSFEILSFPPCDYPIIIGKDLLPLVFPKVIPLCFVSPPPECVAPHKSVNKSKNSSSSSSTDIKVAAAAVACSEEGTGNSSDTETVSSAEDENSEDALVAYVSSTDLDANVLEDVESDPTVFTEPSLEEEYTKHRESLMADPELVSALEENERLTGFCTLKESVLKLPILPFENNVVPKKLCRPQYRIAEKVKHLVRECLARWFDEGKIILAPPGTPYNNPIVVAPKKDSAGNISYDEIRVCLDFRGLNECMDAAGMDQFQLPYIRDTINKFDGCKIFGEFDLAEAFYQLKLHEDSRPYTAFMFEGKQYMCAGVPFGLSIVPSHFQRVISTVTHGLDFTFPYMDNLPFGSKDWDSHKSQALTIIKLMTKFNLRIKPSSVKLGHSQMRCLGHFVSTKGIGIDPKKLSMIPGWPTPKTGKELMSFLGFVTFIRDHVRHVADLTGPLEAVKNQKTLVWNDTLEQAFTLTKKAVMSAPFLQYPDYSKPFHIATDASNTGVGGVLFQPKTEDEYITATNIVAICSKKLQDCQTRWSAYKKEYFGIVYCLRQFRPYVWGRNDLVVHTDHKPLTFVLKSPSLSTTVHGWFDELSEYNFKVIHRPGILNVVPDCLSRMYTGSYPDTWGVAPGFNMTNITLVDAQVSPAPKDVTGPLQDGSSVPSVSVLMGEGAAAEASAEHKLETQEVTLLDSSSSNIDFDLKLELDKRGMSMPASEEDRIELVQREHALGHFGIDAVYKSLLSKNVWWPRMRETITSQIQKCEDCLHFTVTKTGYNPSGFIHATGPWDHIQVDTSVHMPPSPGGKTTLLVVIDVFTGFSILRACASSTAEETAKELWDIFCIFGFPKILQSDNGHEFVNDLLRALVKLSGIEHRFISPYNPRADGKVERAIGTLSSVIKKMVHGSIMLWPMYVPFAQYAFNIKISSLSGCAPFMLMFGRKPNEWKDFTKAPPTSIPFDYDVQLSKWKEHQDKMVSLLLPAVSERILKSKNEMITRLNKTRKALIPKPLSIGTEVYLVDPVRANKWQPKYLGPYTIARRAHNGGYVLRDSTGDILDRHVPIDQLKVLSSKERQPDSDEKDSVLTDAQHQDVAYAVEAIRDHKGDNPSNYQFLVKWVGYPESENTWEPTTSFQDKEVITKYFKALSAAAASSSPSSTTSDNKIKPRTRSSVRRA